MSEHKTEIFVNARAKGFQQVQQQTSKLVETATKAATNQTKGYVQLEGSTRSYRKEIKALESQLRELGKQQLKTLKEMSGVGKATEAYEKLHETFKNLNSESQLLNQRMAITKNLYGPKGAGGRPLTDADMARGGFAQGFAQSMGLNLQRGPGMWRQAAGAATGTMMKGFGAAPFGGVSGVAQGLAGIPVAGGFMAGQFQNAMGFGAGALGVQHARLGMAPYLGGQTGANIGAARDARRAEISPDFFAPGGKFASKEELESRGNVAAAAERRDYRLEQQGIGRLGKALAQTGKIEASGGIGGLVGAALAGPVGLAVGTALGVKRQFRKGQQEESPLVRAQAAKDRAIAEGRAPEEAYNRALASEGEAAASAERARPFQEIKAAGLKYGGMSEAEALQTAQGLLQAGGGGMRGLDQSGMLQTSFAAQTKYGLGAGVSGAYLQAGRAGGGGLAGQGLAGGETMVQGIKDALLMGLEGSDLQDYMGQIAQGIESWKTTGIPINQNSIGRLGQAVTQQTALGGIRGSAIGRGVAGAAQAVSETGVNDAVDLMMLQTMGGYKGGGLEEYEKAQVNLEEMGGINEWGPEQLKEIVSKLTAAGGGGASGRQVLRKALGRKGVKMSQAETIALEKGVMGGEMTKDEQARYAKVQQGIEGATENMPQNAAGLQAQAEEMMKGYGSAVKRAAGIQNKENAVGEKMMDTLQNLQESQAKITTAFTNLTGPTLEKISKVFTDFAGSLEGLTNAADMTAATLRLFGDLAKQFGG